MKKTLIPLAIGLCLTSFALQQSPCQAQTLVGYRSPNPGIMNPHYEMAIEPQFESVALDFSDGIASVQLQPGQHWTYINTSGKPIFNKQYLNPHPFHYGLAAVDENRKWGYIDITGELVVPMEYVYADDFSDNYGVVCIDATGGNHFRYGFIDASGKQIRPPSFLSANDFSEGYAAIKLKNGSWQVLSTRFTATSGMLSYDAIGEFHEGLARVKSGDRYGFIDTLGNLVVPLREGGCADRYSEGLCAVQQDGKWGYMDMTGRIVIPCRFTLVEPFSCSRAVVSESAPNEISGMITERALIDHGGNYIVKEGQFDYIENFSDCYAVVAKDGKYGFINVNGRVVIQMMYEKARGFHEGYAAVQMFGKWGFLHLLDEIEK